MFSPPSPNVDGVRLGEDVTPPWKPISINPTNCARSTLSNYGRSWPLPNNDTSIAMLYALTCSYMLSHALTCSNMLLHALTGSSKLSGNLNHNTNGEHAHYSTGLLVGLNRRSTQYGNNLDMTWIKITILYHTTTVTTYMIGSVCSLLQCRRTNY